MYKILLADDVRLTLATEKAYLEGRNLKVFTTTSALEARDLASVVQPDLVVLDFEMPEMNGAQVCRQLKDDPQTSHIPVLILSIRQDEDRESLCREAGAVGFLNKADGREALLDGVARVLGIPRRRHVRVGCTFNAGINDSGRLFSGTVENVSEGGMFLRSPRRFSQGMALRVSFKLPQVEDPIKALGEVVRSEELGEGTFGLGIQFLEMSPKSRDGLTEFLEKSM